MKKLKVISALLCCSLLLVGCGKGSNGNNSVKNDSKEKAPVELNISAAASLKEVMADLETEYKNEVGEYHCQIMIEDKYTNERIIPLNDFKYKVFDDTISKGGATPDIPSGGATINYDPVTGNLTIRSNSLQYNSQTGNLKI